MTRNSSCAHYSDCLLAAALVNGSGYFCWNCDGDRSCAWEEEIDERTPEGIRPTDS
jgi:hypothetical protein